MRKTKDNQRGTEVIARDIGRKRQEEGKQRENSMRFEVEQARYFYCRTRRILRFLVKTEVDTYSAAVRVRQRASQRN